MFSTKEQHSNIEQQLYDYYEEELDILQTYLEDLGYSDFTIRSYTYDIKLFLAYLYEKQAAFVDVETVSKREISSFLRKQHRNKAKSTRNRRLMSLRTFYKSLIKAEILDYNPAQDIEMAKQENGRLPVYLSDDELDHFLASIAPNEDYIRNKCMLMLMSLTGLRVIEVHNLNTQDIIRDSNEPGIEVLGKGNKTRYIPLPIPLYQLLLEYEKMYRPKVSNSNAFFLSKRGKRISRRRIQEITTETFDRLKERKEFAYLSQKKLSAHKLRHTFGTGMVREGADLVTIQQLMGHTNLNTTQIYTHVNNKQKQEAMNNKDVSRFFN
ncbi:tyrosine-type recombinase/integrase [Gracilibacillus sp. S3-1-1]|uniref:Tyrosine-type recombinase/integrase n=1 Tax=Gracilibacillus pellucidus TaxID=3095368 RepID=A0ACC6M5H9_9BACI|nr:tyrosine-type recombinase/integrase [Gracilibacillus sp. S3-1-1]MDX8046236.1 tyrosine-type recombinase/integrase [Gracilibacillus sp. S3-1-1]